MADGKGRGATRKKERLNTEGAEEEHRGHGENEPKSTAYAY
jgi:hypothetical protein